MRTACVILALNGLNLNCLAIELGKASSVFKEGAVIGYKRHEIHVRLHSTFPLVSPISFAVLFSVLEVRNPAWQHAGLDVG